MPQSEDTYAIPGFMGFVPSYKFGFGLTYGNATRKILQTDSSLKQGRIQREIHRRQVNHTAEQTALASSGDAGGIGQDFNGEGDQLWKRGKKYATGDDRFSFPPVPGYTGYIPRSQEHFGKPFVETTNASLSDFQRMLRHKNELPPRVRAIKAQQRPVICAAGGTSKPVGNKATFAYSAECFPINEESPYHLPENHPQKTFISGYTGFVPRLQNHFGEPYSHSVRKAIDEFTAPGTAGDPYTGKRPETIVEKRIVRTHPIPGFTGFIPGAKYGYFHTFGKNTEIAIDNFNHRDERGRVSVPTNHLPPKDLKANKPIPGYRGHRPLIESQV